MRTRAKKKCVASDRARRENVPRHILFQFHRETAAAAQVERPRFLLIHRQSAVEGITSQFVQQRREIQFIRSSTRGDQLIEQVVYGTAFGKTLIEEIRERLGGGHLFFPGVTPDLVIQIQAPAGIGHLVGHQLPGGHMMAPEQGFHELESCFLPPGGIR